MRALRIHSEGGPEGLLYEEAPDPEPGIGEVLVRVEAASFTPTELTWPSTWVDRSGRDRTPVIPSHEVCGTVAEVGYGTTGFEVGDAVYGLTDWYRDGAAAEYVAVETRNLATKPSSLDQVEAAATAMPALTASEALFTLGSLSEGQTALIHGAGGGVGTAAVQLGRAAGARVIASGRSWARDSALELGASVFIDVDNESLEDAASDVDLVFDLVGGDLLGKSWSVIRPGGRLVSVVEDPAARPEARSDAHSAFFVVEASGERLGELASQLESGKLKPVVGDVRRLADGREAFTAKQAGGLRGKSVLEVSAGTQSG
jgi:NADPH:quinone reductase-like Zn-dependent oxidoreductase